MKRIFAVFVGLFLSLSLFAQKDVTKFMGIPVDGSYNSMSRKLIAKGFQWDRIQECFKGEFNGTDVNILILTNNKKVYRILVQDAKYRDANQIKRRFNTLCSQFENNKNYTSLSEIFTAYSDKKQTIPEDENVRYEMTVHNKQYEATYFQVPEQLDSVKVEKELFRRWDEVTQDEDFDMTEEELAMEMTKITIEYSYEIVSRKTVWFTIDERGGQYGIVMFYDNKYNQANGEDL